MSKLYPDSWSVGKVGAFESCPKKYEGKYVLRMPEPKSPAAARGDAIHAKADRFLSGKLRQMPAELKKLSTTYRELRKKNPMTEQKIAIARGWKLASWASGWLRCILDVLHVDPPRAEIVDHKTGRVYQHHTHQAEVYACAVAALGEEIEDFDVRFAYTDKGIVRPWRYDREEVLDLQEQWAERAERTLRARRFPARPSGEACRWCPRASDAGGDCDEWRKVRMPRRRA